MSQIIVPKPAKPILSSSTPRKKRRTTAEWRLKFSIVPEKRETPAETASQRALFERHDEVALEIRLPMSPSMNDYWKSFSPRNTTRVIVAVSPEGVAYKEAVARIWRNCHKGWTPDPLTGRLRLLALMHFANRRATDIDNRLKALLDAMNEAEIFEDDSQFDDVRASRGCVDPAGVGYIDVWVETIEE